MSGESDAPRSASVLPPGIHLLRVRAERVGGGAGKTQLSELPFQVIDDTRELTVSRADHDLLRRLSRTTADIGGASFRADQVDELVDRIVQQRRRAQRVVVEKFRLGDDAFSAWLLFFLFAGALSVEWSLRRKWGLA